MLRSRRGLSLLAIIAAGALAGVGARALEWGGAEAGAGTSDSIGSIVIPAGNDPEAAARDMSDIAGFQVRLPTYLPEGDAVTALSTPSETRDRPFRYVLVGISGDSGGMLIVERDVAPSLPRTLDELELDVAGARA